MVWVLVADTIMTFVYCDAALANERGHFATVCRFITGQLRRHGVKVLVLGHARMDPDLAADLGATPFFRHHPNAVHSNDPLCGWLETFFHATRVTAEDLGRLGGFTTENLLLYDHAKPAQLMALIDWAQARFQPAACPTIVITFGWPGGLDRRMSPDGTASWALRDPRMMLYRYASQMLRAPHAERFVFAAYDPDVAAAYGFLLDRKVLVFPPPNQAVCQPRERIGVAQPTVAFLGEQRGEKGYGRLPGIVRLLLARHASIRILVHNSWEGLPEVSAELRQLAAMDPRVECLFCTLTAEQWAGVLGRSDLIVLPYDQSVYATAISGIGVEAIANGIPLAVPRHTTMERLLADHDMPGTVFEQSDEAQVATAVGSLLAEYDTFAERARQASLTWATRAGAAGLIQAILHCRKRPLGATIPAV